MAQHIPIIISVANQKGGVGKTTLAACLANYMSFHGIRVMVIDCDRQQSIFRSRKRDIAKYGESALPYEITGYRVLDHETMRNIIKNVYNAKEIDIVIFDCPGSMSDPWLVPLFANTDYVLIPYHYDDITIASTSEFILFLEKINSSVRNRTPLKLVMIPNMIDRRIGTRTELFKWEETKSVYSNHGLVTTPVAKKADMERFSTICNLDRQLEIVSPAFDEIIKNIPDLAKKISDNI